MNREGLFNFVPAALGIDPSSTSIGLCLMHGDGEVIKTWSVKAKGGPLQRLYDLYNGLSEVFSEVLELMRFEDVRVYIEEGIFAGKRMHVKVAAMIGEVRGIIMAMAWIRGLKVQKIPVQSWKALLSKEERKMKKGAEYTKYWCEHLGLHATSPDEIDAYMIARRAIRGKL